MNDVGSLILMKTVGNAHGKVGNVFSRNNQCTCGLGDVKLAHVCHVM